MHYDSERKKKHGVNIIAVVIVAAVIIVIGLAVFFNWDKISYYFKNGEMPGEETVLDPTEAPEITPLPATPEPVEPINFAGSTIGTRFNPPAGYERVAVESGSFAEYLRNFQLKSYGTVAKLADGTDNLTAPTEAVLELDVRKNGLQQCADSIIRLYAEYRYARGEYEYVSFDCYTNPVFTMNFSFWTQGNRVRANGNKLEWYQPDNATPGDTSYSTFRYYLDNVFNYANTYSLKNQMMQIDSADLQVGDCLIITADQTGGTDGHAMIVVDVAVEKSTGKKVFMIAEGNTPATEMYVIKDYANDTVWFSLNEDGTFTKQTADGRTVTYPLDAFRRFKR
jgi:hypothetical protein